MPVSFPGWLDVDRLPKKDKDEFEKLETDILAQEALLEAVPHGQKRDLKELLRLHHARMAMVRNHKRKKD